MGDLFEVNMKAEEVVAIVLNRGIQPRIGDFGMLEFDGDPKVLTEPLMKVIRLHETAIKRLVASRWTPEVKGSGGTTAPKVPLTPSDEKLKFDWDAERLIRDLYATDHGLLWKDDKVSTFPHDRDPRLTPWFKRAVPMLDRIEAHVRPRDLPTPQTIERCKKLGIDKIEITHAIELKHKDAGKVFTAHYAVRGEKQAKRQVKKPSEKEKAGTPENSRTKKNDGPIIRHEPYTFTPVETWLYVVEEQHPFLWEPPVLFSAWRYAMDNDEHWRMLWGRYIYTHAGAVWVPWGARRSDGGRFQ